MKADNIGLDNLEEVVSFAHLRGVKVYVTINTLIATNEMNELVDMVGACLFHGVDAFIVQDLGVVKTLKSVYPNIVLHGSTQLGVHNVRGARVAKSIGLSRVVLSREATIEDIKAIKDEVDIELEVFVQGAMCVAFSGNCYVSSLKHNASGNRGLCKQLCRLGYKLNSNGENASGYMLSPRDNCMVEYIENLCKLGVYSFKIEGRLRRPGYVGIATRVYRELVDRVVLGKYIDANIMKEYKYQLSKVFSRGEFVSGYNDGNNIIDISNNAHMGEKIGEVVGCEKFKDIYRILIKTDVCLSSGDGLKIVDLNGKVLTLGVGNVDVVDDKCVVYGKNYCKIGSIVYRVLDSQFENNILDLAKKRQVDIDVDIRINQPIFMRVKIDDFVVEKLGAVVQVAKSKPIDCELVRNQILKLNEDAFICRQININIDQGVFLPVSEINNIRREAISELRKNIIDSYRLKIEKTTQLSCDDSGMLDGFDKIAIVDENSDCKSLKNNYNRLIISPSVYSVSVIEKFWEKYNKFYELPLIINLPIIALKDDLIVIDKIVEFAKDHNIELMANNIYALDYIREGAVVWAGANMNVVSLYSASALKEMGVKEIVWSIEKWCAGNSKAYKMCNGRRVLMTMAHCPIKTINGNECNNCKYNGVIHVSGEGVNYSIRRYRVAKCYFELVDGVVEARVSDKSIDDLRG